MSQYTIRMRPDINVKNLSAGFPSAQVKPFLRWAGGKRKLVPQLISIIPNSYNGMLNRYFEPFVGAGSLMLALGEKNLPSFTPGKNLFINDLNPDLIVTYQTIRDSVQELIDELSEIGAVKTKTQFENVKKWVPRNSIERAARFIYLNKTCFNGLWRVNSKGEFNVPWGKIKNPNIVDSRNLELVSERIKNSVITELPYASALEACKLGDFVYLDPPYIPLSKSSSFSKYSKHDFSSLDHYSLVGVVRGLTERGAFVVLSNSDTRLSRQIYGKEMYLYQIKVNRSISANSNSRMRVNELIATNFKLKKSLLGNGITEI